MTAPPLPVPALRSSPTLDALRAWCNELQGVDDVDGQTLEVCAVLGHVGRFEREWLRLAIEGVAGHPTFAPTPGFLAAHPRFGNELASDIGQLVADEDLWPWLRLFVRHLARLQLSGTPLERVLAQVLAVCMREHDDEGVKLIVGLLPAEVTWDILAFNLACHCAVKHDKDGLLRFTRRALQLGKSPSQFTSDSDFEGFLDDLDFQAVLRSVE